MSSADEELADDPCRTRKEGLPASCARTRVAQFVAAADLPLILGDKQAEIVFNPRSTVEVLRQSIYK